MSLIEHLQGIRDFRTEPTYPLWVILLLVIMALMSGRHGYRPTARFVQRHQKALLELLQISHPRLPSLSTLRRIMVRLDFVELAAAFNAWAKATFEPSATEQIATDGKSIKVSVRDYDQSYQDFINIVSAFSVEQGVVLGLRPMSNQQTSEIETVRQLLETLQLKDVCFSLDALHAQKKRSKPSSAVAITT
jgi:hypothetical protein